MTQLWLFDELDQIAAQEKPAEKEWADLRTEMVCSHCGESGFGQYWMNTNHGIVFNGWCAKRLSIGSRTAHGLKVALDGALRYGESWLNHYFDDRKWLFEKGFDHLADPYDRKTWTAGHVPYWEKL